MGDSTLFQNKKLNLKRVSTLNLKMFMRPTLGAYCMMKYWSKFVQSFCKLDHLRAMEKVLDSLVYKKKEN